MCLRVVMCCVCVHREARVCFATVFLCPSVCVESLLLTPFSSSAPRTQDGVLYITAVHANLMRPASAPSSSSLVSPTGAPAKEEKVDTDPYVFMK